MSKISDQLNTIKDGNHKSDFSEDSQKILNEESSRNKPEIWWKNHSLIISVLAFLLSLATASFSALVGHRKDIHDQQTQLSAQTQLLSNLNIKYFEMIEKYRGSQMEGNIVSLITAQINTVYKNATEIALRLGTYATTAEFVTLALGAQNMGDITNAKLLYELALAAARTVNDESAALRGLGFMDLRWATSPEMRDRGASRFRQAGNLDAKYAALPDIPGVLPYLKAIAEFNWAGAISHQNCNEARVHFSNGRQFLAGAPSTPDIEQLRRASEQEAKAGIGGVLNCLPNP
ncbi:hypothetical protein [Roseicella frigidaeris]|uniref:hypothetical protein n=1 Tax=Roseicella frigidaeris TaxID=2230885 RepID=UPI000FDECA30|nr:hypothetical protein [Roseicella frigidaeris]